MESSEGDWGDLTSTAMGILGVKEASKDPSALLSSKEVAASTKAMKGLSIDSEAELTELSDEAMSLEEATETHLCAGMLASVTSVVIAQVESDYSKIIDVDVCVTKNQRLTKNMSRDQNNWFDFVR